VGILGYAPTRENRFYRNGEVISLMKRAKATKNVFHEGRTIPRLENSESAHDEFYCTHVKRYEIEGTKTIRGMSDTP